MAHADVCAGLVDGQVQEARVLEVLGALAARLRGARLAYPAPRPRPATRLRRAVGPSRRPWTTRSPAVAAVKHRSVLWRTFRYMG